MAEDMPKKGGTLSIVQGQLLHAKRFEVRARGCYALIKNLFASKKVSSC
jgi:hypothetical protein